MIGGWKSYMLNLWNTPPPHSLIFEKFEKSVAVPDMAPEPELRRQSIRCSLSRDGWVDYL